MSPQQRAELSRALSALDDPVPPGESDLPAGPVRRAIALVVIIGGCMGLAAWIGVLAVTLPRYYHTGGWRGAWVGFDIVELVAFAVTAWAAWKHRQLVIGLPHRAGHAALLRRLVRRHAGPADQRI